ncbi:MAG TPA: iron ABC transporter permease [Chthoniobacteraceae bacterium]|nr:iron ABC transporter permease [Chthoniobacteraceae bacterium]
MSSRSLRRRGRVPVMAFLGVALLGAALFSLHAGALKIPLEEVAQLLWARASGAPPEASPFEAVLWSLRLPRLLFGLLVGGTLSVAGALMQGLFRNPLADPGLIGVSSGAALGAVTIIVFGTAFFPGVSWLGDLRWLPVAAFVGALLVTMLVQGIATVGGFTAVAMLLLAGIAMNAIVVAVIGVSTFMASDLQMRTLSFWTLGSLGAATWETLALASPFCLGLLLLAPFFAPGLNAMALGEAEAEHLGFSVERIKRIMVVATAAGVGVCVAFTGLIGFIGLVVPHLVRLLLGPDHRWVIPGSALLGAILLTVADTASRTLVAPAEMPIGILTAAFGGPFFLAMLFGQRRNILGRS